MGELARHQFIMLTDLIPIVVKILYYRLQLFPTHALNGREMDAVLLMRPGEVVRVNRLPVWPAVAIHRLADITGAGNVVPIALLIGLQIAGAEQFFLFKVWAVLCVLIGVSIFPHFAGAMDFLCIQRAVRSMGNHAVFIRLRAAGTLWAFFVPVVVAAIRSFDVLYGDFSERTGFSIGVACDICGKEVLALCLRVVAAVLPGYGNIQHHAGDIARLVAGKPHILAAVYGAVHPVGYFTHRFGIFLIGIVDGIDGKLSVFIQLVHIFWSHIAVVVIVVMGIAIGHIYLRLGLCEAGRIKLQLIQRNDCPQIFRQAQILLCRTRLHYPAVHRVVPLKPLDFRRPLDLRQRGDDQPRQHYCGKQQRQQPAAVLNSRFTHIRMLLSLHVFIYWKRILSPLFPLYNFLPDGVQPLPASFPPGKYDGKYDQHQHGRRRYNSGDHHRPVRFTHSVHRLDSFFFLRDIRGAHTPTSSRWELIP